MKRLKRPPIKEQVIETQIRSFLSAKRIFHWKAKTVGTFDPTKKVFRKNAGYRKGVSDIIGIFNGRALAIEVKSEKGRLSDEQKEFQHEFRLNGGIAFVARSVEDVRHGLEHWRKYTHQQIVEKL
jgi:penicillin-binding protein-related factor A (putative recombinase)